VSRRAAFAAILLAGSAGSVLANPAKAPGDPIVMAGHRAVYDLTLKDSGDRKGLEAARGRIVYEFSGSACEGYALNFRQVTELSGGEIGTRLSDIRSTTFEDGDGSQLTFKTDSRYTPGRTETSDGSAQHKSGKTVVKLKKPAPGTAEIDGEVYFPTAHMRRLVEAARAGETTVTAKVYDGSEKARQAYDTFAVIGRPVDLASHSDDLLKKVGWEKLQRWPVTVSYFEEGGQAEQQQPLYTIGFQLLENGVSRNLRLDYGDFVLVGDLKTLDVLPAADCKK
jgi:hypothetical protein